MLVSFTHDPEFDEQQLFENQRHYNPSMASSMCLCAGILVIYENNQNALAEPTKPNDLLTFAQNFLDSRLMIVSI
jgi:hypothetical protein